MNKLQKLGSATSALAVMALLTYLGFSGEAHWCRADGSVYAGGVINQENPWLLSDGQDTVVCEIEGVHYPWVTCTAEGGCEGKIAYCNEVMYLDDQPGVCID